MTPAQTALAFATDDDEALPGGAAGHGPLTFQAELREQGRHLWCLLQRVRAAFDQPTVLFRCRDRAAHTGFLFVDRDFKSSQMQLSRSGQAGDTAADDRDGFRAGSGHFKTSS